MIRREYILVIIIINGEYFLEKGGVMIGRGYILVKIVTNGEHFC